MRTNASLLEHSNLSSGPALPNDRTIALSVIAGPSAGLTRELTKSRTSIGKAGGGADIEIDDPQVSPMHCAIGLTEDTVRLCDLDSTDGTYVNDERIQAVDLEHLSEFRIGSTWFMVVISRKHSA